MDKKLRDYIIRLHRNGLAFRQISNRLNISIDQIWDVIEAYHSVQDPNKFPPWLLEDWDRTRLMVLKKYGGEKYRGKT